MPPLRGPPDRAPRRTCWARRKSRSNVFHCSSSMTPSSLRSRPISYSITCLILGQCSLRKLLVLRHQVLAIALEHGAALPVGGVGLRRVFAAETDATGFGIEADAQVLHDAGTAFQFGKEAGHALGVVPDVRAGAVAAADPLPGPKAAVPPPLHRVRRQRADRHHEPRAGASAGSVLSKYVSWKSRVRSGQTVEVLLQVLRDGSAHSSNQLPYIRPCSPPAKCQREQGT